MPLQNILVHTGSFREWRVQVACAAALAARRQARLTGVYIQSPLDRTGLPDDCSALERERDAALAAAAGAGPAFAAFASRHGAGDSEFQAVRGDPALVMALAGAWHDLLVLGLGDHASSSGYDPLERIVLQSRRPCLLVPPSGSDAAFDCIAIGWNGSLESIRAVKAALPLLRGASRVVLFEGPERDYGVELPVTTLQATIARLEREGVRIERHTLEDRGPDAGAALLDAAGSINAGLLVMGAYGHARISEWLLGGATRHVLRHAELPLLMRH
jgi:nucleotide-binding universal stress UspA family protein